jgi:hypothetical protein
MPDYAEDKGNRQYAKDIREAACHECQQDSDQSQWKHQDYADAVFVDERIAIYPESSDAEPWDRSTHRSPKRQTDASFVPCADGRHQIASISVALHSVV